MILARIFACLVAFLHTAADAEVTPWKIGGSGLDWAESDSLAILVDKVRLGVVGQVADQCPVRRERAVVEVDADQRVARQQQTGLERFEHGELSWSLMTTSATPTGKRSAAAWAIGAW